MGNPVPATMIDEFHGEHAFLSNFYPAIVVLDGHQYPSVEHAYQAAKSTEPQHRTAIRIAPTAGHAKRLGRRVPVRADWEDVKVDVMRALLIQKFSAPPLRERLLDTGDEILIEGNTWHDSVWGTCTCGACPPGKNMLGKLLMEVRDGLRR